MNNQYKDLIRAEFKICVENTIERLKKNPTHRPFHEALLSPEVLLWSRFERSFSTSFGQRAIERISKYVAMAYGAEAAETQRETQCSLSHYQLTAIEEHVSSLRQNTLGRAPNWVQDLNGLLEIIGESDSNMRVISDLWFKKNDIEIFISIKTVKPNIDQTAEAKRDLLKLKLFKPNAMVYFGLYYNPYGETKETYNWTPPMGIFNFKKDNVVLIGREYWETVGGDGAYEIILELAKEVGKETRGMIRDI
ncbi:hypothetical protein MNBD_GAMMA21-1603 [hydrothermal vent metagenome]|uniref:type II site-specific deoxyribonuclease n=1 Tax=hydrothermal vent metagenome TaxID=652676 RepID=A0A3B0ZTJ1_9ZZZZ